MIRYFATSEDGSRAVPLAQRIGRFDLTGPYFVELLIAKIHIIVALNIGKTWLTVGVAFNQEAGV
jgi:hypothetical protein